ncbi:MAG: VCBS repeat-containing protein [Phycisphaerae bacterium]|nr:VCBS repeat-containing protein [Phycisphaerae bacterium]
MAPIHPLKRDILPMFLISLIFLATHSLCLAESSNAIAGHFGFGTMEPLKLEWSLGKPIVCDLNTDGLNDIIVINNRKARIEQLMQKKDFEPENILPISTDLDDINDIFGKEKAWRFKRYSYPLNVAAISLVVTDINNDKLPDLAFWAKDGLYIVLQKPAELSESKSTDSVLPRQSLWQPVKKIDIREGAISINALMAGDINNDQLTDLALLTTNGAFVIVQKTDGTLAEPVRYFSASDTIKKGFLADINSDKRTDLVFLTGHHEEYPLRVRFQMANGKLGPEIRYRLPVPSALELFSLDDSGNHQIFSISQQSGRVLISAMSDASKKQEFPAYTYPLPKTSKSSNRDIITADINGDRLLDVIVTDPARAEFLVYAANKQASLNTYESFPGLKDMRKLCAARLNNAGKESIVAFSPEEKLIALTHFKNGRLTFPETIAITGEPLAIDLADINGDLHPDLVYIAKDKVAGSRSSKFFMRTVINLGQSGAAPGPELELTALKDDPLDIKTADIDHDGRIDILVFRSYEPIFLIRQKTANQFTQETGVNINAGLVTKVKSQSVTFAPLAPGGKTAALITEKNFSRALFFDDQQGWKVVDQYQAPHPQSNITAATACKLSKISAAIDIVTFDGARNKLVLLAQQADGTYRTENQIDMDAFSVEKILTGDFGGPTATSILLTASDRLVRIPISDQIATIGQVASFEPDIQDGRYAEITVGDINSDGCPDIILSEQNRHHLQILTFDPQGTLVNAMTFKVFEQPRGVASSPGQGRQATAGEPRYAIIAEVTGDKKNDLVLLVHNRIVIYPQD